MSRNIHSRVVPLAKSGWQLVKKKAATCTNCGQLVLVSRHETPPLHPPVPPSRRPVRPSLPPNPTPALSPTQHRHATSLPHATRSSTSHFSPTATFPPFHRASVDCGGSKEGGNPFLFRAVLARTHPHAAFSSASLLPVDEIFFPSLFFPFSPRMHGL
jgi:hypothetical protein